MAKVRISIQVFVDPVTSRTVIITIDRDTLNSYPTWFDTPEQANQFMLKAVTQGLG